MRRNLIYSITSIIIIGLCSLFFMKNGGGAYHAVLADVSSHEPNWLVVAPGRVEPISKEIEIGSEITGKIKVVLVEEGDRVQRGELMGVIKFGSRVDVLVPESYKVLVQKGDRVRDGLTPLAAPPAAGEHSR